MINKFKSNRGSLGTILAYIVVALPLIYIILLGFTWKIKDNTYDYIDAAVRTAVDIGVKKGEMNTDIDNFLRNKIDQVYDSNDYEIIYGKQDINDIGTRNIDIYRSMNTKISYKVGDVLYIQFKLVNETKEPMYSKLIKLITSSDPGEEDNFDRLLIIHQGMVEVNGN